MKASCVFLGAVLLLFTFLPPVNAADTLDATVTSAFAGRKAHTAKGERLLSDAAFLENCAGTGNGDWAAFAMARFSAVDGKGKPLYDYEEDYDTYRDALQAKLTAYYKANGVRSGTKLTEYFRMGIALTALGGDCTEILAAATVLNPTALTRQSIITLDFALIALTMTDFEIPENAQHTPQDYADRILALQTADGGWSLTAAAGGEADVDVTAMTLTALAPYYRAGDKAVTAAADKALTLLSKRQSNYGDYATYGLFNCESTAQVLTALTSMGIDQDRDARFIKNGKTVLDGLMRYRLPDGSFTHSYTVDPENGAAEAGAYNYLATDQASYALVSLWRLRQGQNALYDLRPDTKTGFAAFAQRLADVIRTLIARLKAIVRFD